MIYFTLPLPLPLSLRVCPDLYLYLGWPEGRMLSQMLLDDPFPPPSPLGSRETRRSTQKFHPRATALKGAERPHSDVVSEISELLKE